MEHDHETGGDEEAYDVLDAMEALTNRIALERELARVERRIAAFPEGVVDEALRLMRVAGSEADNVPPLAPENDSSAVPQPRSNVD